MFTGLIEETGRLGSIRRGTYSAVLSIRAATVLKNLKIGDSIAVNGVYLTVTSFDRSFFCADVIHETLVRGWALRVPMPSGLQGGSSRATRRRS